MKDFAFRLATDDDDQDLQDLMARNSVPGRVEVAYERSPSYFKGCATLGPFCQVLTARHVPTGRLAGVASRSSRALFVNGRPEEVGYLGQLRVDREFRGRWLVSEGFQQLRRLHEDGRVSGYVTTIIEGNIEALGVLVKSARDGIPRYREAGRLETLSLFVRPRRKTRNGTWEIRWGSEVALEEILAFLARAGRSRQFFPVYEMEDFAPGATRTAGFRVEDFAVAVRGGEIHGVLGLWDQSAYKQTVVRGYGRALRWGKPFWDAFFQVAGGASLPRPGEVLRFAYASFGHVAEDNGEAYRLLLEALVGRARERGLGYLVVGLARGDPLLPVARRFPHISYPSRLYTVDWDKGAFHARLDGRVPYVEVAAL